MAKKTHTKAKRGPNITVFLEQADFDRLTALCEERGITRADFVRAAIQSADLIPTIKTRPLCGIAKIKHEARLKRERKAKKKEV